MSRRNRVSIGAIAAVLALILIAGIVWLTHEPDDDYVPSLAGDASSAEVIERGRVLTYLANCQACHTARGGEPFAGGRELPSEFGTFYSPNITPDAQTGIGGWSERDFWRAVHLGYSKDGSVLYPSFPYPSFTKITQQDANAIFAYLKTIKPVSRRAPAHALNSPYKYRWLLHVWRAFYFRPGAFQADTTKDAEWNRGAYLVQVSHCDFCHVSRDSLGGPQPASKATGGTVLGWYAPQLNQPTEAGLQHWTTESVVELLGSGRVTGEPGPGGAPPARVTEDPRPNAATLARSTEGSSPNSATLGPMAEVVFESLQHAPRADLQSMAVYLEALPTASAPAALPPLSDREAPMLDRGKAVYKDRCATCHGDAGEGKLPASIALAGNRAVTLKPALNAIRVVLYGGYPPGTADNPQPFGMPPFAQDLSNEQIADVLNFVRNSWGNRGEWVTADAVNRTRTGPLW
jgi:mono/diheme cytochrome c family protein